MKTTEDFYNDRLGAMRVLEEYWQSLGYKTSVYTYSNGQYVCAVVVDDGGEEQKFIALFERV